MFRQSLIINSLTGIFQPLPIVPSLGFQKLCMLIANLLLANTIFSADICIQPEIACAAQLRLYPLLRSQEASGKNAELSVNDFPFYDEFLAPNNVFDFSKETNLTHERICDCPKETSCGSEVGNSIKLDEMITLVFCTRVDDIFKRPCYGSRSFIRVIGQIHESGEALTTVVKTFLFCKCEKGYRRIRVEPWRNHLYAIIYQCL